MITPIIHQLYWTFNAEMAKRDIYEAIERCAMQHDAVDAASKA
jgi:hypothetical protein